MPAAGKHKIKPVFYWFNPIELLRRIKEKFMQSFA